MSRVSFIPETPEELTPAWLTTVLTENGVVEGGAVTGVRTSNIGEGVGFLGDILRLELEYDGSASGPQSVIAKLPKLANRPMGEMLGAYEREALFYLDQAGVMPVTLPQMYFCDFDRDKGSEQQASILAFADRIPRFLNGPMTSLALKIATGKKRRYALLIEDINYGTPGDQVAGASVAECQRVLGKLALVQAKFWHGKDIADRFWLLPLTIDRRMRHHMFMRSKPNFEATFADLMDQGLRAHMERLVAHGIDFATSLEAAPMTLLHCDLRLDNVMFTADDVVFLDWQLVRRGVGAYDVAYLLGGALATDLSPDDDERLLRWYFDELVKNGVDDYSFHAFTDHYRLSLYLILQTLSTTDQVELGEGRGLQMIRTWIERLHRRLDNAAVFIH